MLSKCLNTYTQKKCTVLDFFSLISTDGADKSCALIFFAGIFDILSAKKWYLKLEGYHILSQYKDQNKHCSKKKPLRSLDFWRWRCDMKTNPNVPISMQNSMKISIIKILTHIFGNLVLSGCVLYTLALLQFSNHLKNFYQPNSRCNFGFFDT